MKSNLKIYITSLKEDILGDIKNNNYLPIFAIRRISKSPVIGRYSNTPVHFPSLAPSDELMEKLEKNTIETERFEKECIIELSRVSIQDTVKKLEYLSDRNNSAGVVIVTEGDTYKNGLLLVLKYSGFLIKEVEEYGYKH